MGVQHLFMLLLTLYKIMYCCICYLCSLFWSYNIMYTVWTVPLFRFDKRFTQHAHKYWLQNSVETLYNFDLFMLPFFCQQTKKSLKTHKS
jgi:hypothetical protein